MTHDYKRNGTTTLFAALSTLDGKVISRYDSRHRHQEWLKFLKQIDAETPQELDLQPHRGQLCDAQTSARPILAKEASALSYALYSDLPFLVEPRGALVP